MENEVAYKMVEPNQEIEVYSGNCQFTVADSHMSYHATGTFRQSWFPSPHIKFDCKVYGLPFMAGIKADVRISIDELPIGSARIKQYRYRSQTEGLEDELQICHTTGTLEEEVILGDPSIKVEQINFMIPNLRGLKNNYSINDESNERLLKIFQDDFCISIEQFENHFDLEKKLYENGGYIFLHKGSITKGINKKISLAEARKVLEKLSLFLSFLNGQRVACMLVIGSNKSQISWIDCSTIGISVDSFRPVFSWPIERFDITSLWSSFSKRWETKVGNMFIKTAVYWYLEANVGEIKKCDTSIVLSQTALELIYNTIIIESSKFLIGRDAINLTASNKIRLILLDLNIPTYVPLYTTELKLLINDKTPDAPEILVNIRNSLVHSNVDKLTKLSQITLSQKFEALTLLQWYIELALLKYFEYHGKYRNRTNKGIPYWSEGEVVPWYD